MRDGPAWTLKPSERSGPVARTSGRSAKKPLSGSRILRERGSARWAAWRGASVTRWRRSLERPSGLAPETERLAITMSSSPRAIAETSPEASSGECYESASIATSTSRSAAQKSAGTAPASPPTRSDGARRSRRTGASGRSLLDPPELRCQCSHRRRRVPDSPRGSNGPLAVPRAGLRLLSLSFRTRPRGDLGQ